MANFFMLTSQSSSSSKLCKAQMNRAAAGCPWLWPRLGLRLGFFKVRGPSWFCMREAAPAIGSERVAAISTQRADDAAAGGTRSRQCSWVPGTLLLSAQFCCCRPAVQPLRRHQQQQHLTACGPGVARRLQHTRGASAGSSGVSRNCCCGSDAPHLAEPSAARPSEVHGVKGMRIVPCTRPGERSAEQKPQTEDATHFAEQGPERSL